MRNRIFAFIATIVVVISCNNHNNLANTSKTPKGDTAIVYKDSMQKTDDSAELFILTAEQIKDDSLFDGGNKPTSWSDAGIDDPVGFKMFLKKLQVWVRKDERDSVATVIKYPFGKAKIKDAASFKKEYDTFFTSKVKTALQQQNFSQIFRNYQGVMIGEGEIWFNQHKNNFKIIAINN